MGYIRDVERELRAKLHGLEDKQMDDIVGFVKDKIYQSYKNGCNQNDSGKRGNKKRYSKKD